MWRHILYLTTIPPLPTHTHTLQVKWMFPNVHDLTFNYPCTTGSASARLTLTYKLFIPGDNIDNSNTILQFQVQCLSINI